MVLSFRFPLGIPARSGFCAETRCPESGDLAEVWISAFEHLGNVFLSFFSYVLANCLPSVVSAPYTTILSWLPLYTVTICISFRDQYLTYFSGLLTNMACRGCGGKPIYSNSTICSFVTCYHSRFSSIPTPRRACSEMPWPTCRACVLFFEHLSRDISPEFFYVCHCQAFSAL